MLTSIREWAVAILLPLSTMGCAVVSEMVEIDQYPRDTAISIDERKYLINTFKCADIRTIDEQGVLECYAADGTKSLPVSPAGAFQLSAFEDQFEFAWGSEAHQAWLYEFHYLGGKERLARQIIGAFTQIQNTIDIMNTTFYTANDMQVQFPQYAAPQRFEAFKGFPVKDIREYSIADWHLNNYTYFQTGNIAYDGDEVIAQRIGRLTFHSNGLRSYDLGSTTYTSNGVSTIQINDATTYSNDGTICAAIGNMTRCRRN